MRRRDIVSFMGGAAAIWPLLAYAQQNGRTRSVAMLEPVSPNAPGAKARPAAFLEGLQQASWTPGRDIQVDVRWTAGASRPNQRRTQSY